MKTKLLTTIALLCASLTLQADAVDIPDASATSDNKVWVCGGPRSKRYHKTRECVGLRSCSKQPRRINIGVAKDAGLTPCRWCYKSR